MLERASGKLSLAFRARAGKAVLSDLYQEGCLKARFPRQQAHAHKNGVLINTTGGIADGDRLDISVNVGKGASVVLTTQAAERVYKAANILNPAKVANRIFVATGASLYWLPQETIVFDGGALSRDYEVDLAAGATCLLAEMTVFGRVARGEAVSKLSLFDRWRLRYEGSLVFADGFRLSGGIADVQASDARLKGATSIATLLYIGPDVADMRATLRACFEDSPCHAACTLRGNLLITRVAAQSPSAVRAALMQANTALDSARGMASPVLSRWIF
jgi:urease accessory protein